MKILLSLTAIRNALTLQQLADAKNNIGAGGNQA